MTYKVTIVYTDGSAEVVKGVPSFNAFSNSFMFYNVRRSQSSYRDAIDVSSIHIVPEIHDIIKNYKKEHLKK